MCGSSFTPLLFLNKREDSGFLFVVVVLKGIQIVIVKYVNLFLPVSHTEIN